MDMQEKYNRLTILEYTRTDSNYQKWYMCRCDCGTIREFRIAHIKNGNTKSCGCLQKEKVSTLAKRTLTKHGYTGTRTYTIWKDMRARTKETYSQSQYYHRKGVTVCERWNSFENFLDDMGECPEGMSIDRINGGGNYEPSNCRWATNSEQGYNRTNSVRLNYRGNKITYAEAMAMTGFPYKMLHARINSLGWSVEKAIETAKIDNKTKLPAGTIANGNA